MVIRTNKCFVFKAPSQNGGATAFVPHPTMRGIWVRTDECVAYVPCPVCQSAVGIPCESRVVQRGERRWIGSTHYRRRDAFMESANALREGAAPIAAFVVDTKGPAPSTEAVELLDSERAFFGGL